LNASNTFAGNVSVSIGSLVLNNGGALGTGAKTITVNNGTAGLDQLHLNGSGGVELEEVAADGDAFFPSTHSR
jgi:flagellar basal body L-ring protein FlgH